MRPLYSAKALRPAALGLLVLAGPGLAGAVRPEVPASLPAGRVHEVKRGDTLSGIARRYGVSVAALVTTNRLPGPGGVLRVGARLVIPPTDAAGVTLARFAPPRATAGPGEPSSNAAADMRRGAPAPQAPAGLVLSVPSFEAAAPPFLWPAEGPVTSSYGRRGSGWHAGIDIKAERGTPIHAAAVGVVIASGVESSYGRVVKIEHENGFVTVYAHNDENLVEVGDRVAAGDMIATTGKTGRATTHHVHFEIQRHGQSYNPLYLLPLPPRIAQVEESDENPPDD